MISLLKRKQHHVSTNHLLPKKVICPACGGRDAISMVYPNQIVENFKDLTVLGCTDCAFSLVPNSPSFLDDYYNEQYEQFKARNSWNSYEEFKQGADYKVLKRRADNQLSIISQYKKDIGTIVDIGAYFGVFLLEAKAKKRIAVEPGANAQGILKSNKIDIIEKDISLIADDIADVVSSSHQLEHIVIDELYDFIGHIKRILKKDGVFFLEVPNANLLYLDLPNNKHVPHTLFFSAESVCKLLEKMGFEILFTGDTGKGELPLLDNPPYQPRKTEFFRKSNTSLNVCAKIQHK